MHIGFDAKRAFRNFTGLGNYSRATITILSDFYPDNHYFLYTPSFRQHPLLSFANPPNITVRQPEGMLKRFPAAWRRIGMSNDVRFDKINLFHGLTAELPANLSNKVKSVVTVHDLIFLRYPEYYKPIDRWLYARKCRNACEQADLIIAISQQTKQDIVDFFGIDEQKIRLVYQGCDPQFYAEVSPHRLQMVKRLYRLPDRYILYVGTIEARKNLKVLVKALAQLPDDVHLVCVGRETEYALAVRETADELNVLSRVQFLPQVAFKHLPAIYRQAQTFCLPSLFEGFGIPVLEALNAQVPVVTSNSSSLPEAAGNGALLVNPSDDAEIAHALRQTLDDPELRLRMISAGTLHARQFREDAIAHNLWRVYKELVP